MIMFVIVLFLVNIGDRRYAADEGPSKSFCDIDTFDVLRLLFAWYRDRITRDAIDTTFSESRWKVGGAIPFFLWRFSISGVMRYSYRRVYLLFLEPFAVINLILLSRKRLGSLLGASGKV